MKLMSLAISIILNISMRRAKSFSTHFQSKLYSSSSNVALNRIFADIEECVQEKGNLSLVLHNVDERSLHIRKVLKLEEGDKIRVGVLGIGITDNSCIKLKNEEALTISIGEVSTLKANRRPNVDMILAVPRPLRLERLLPVISSMGIGKLILVDAMKVEKSFFGSHLFRRPDELKKGLVEGLSQSGVDENIPEVLVRRDLKKFMKTELENKFPVNEYRRVPALPHWSDGSTKKVVIAVGPEGGWDDSELALFENSGFLGVNIGERVLRTDTAVTALIALAHEWLETTLS